jgi:hypothetical protein
VTFDPGGTADGAAQHVRQAGPSGHHLTAPRFAGTPARRPPLVSR